MKYKKSFGEITFEVANVIFMWIVMATIVTPFVYMFAQSISDPEQVGLMKVTLIPKGIQWNSYKTVFEDPKIWTAFRNSITMTVVGTALALLFQGLAAFALSRSTFRAKTFFTIMFHLIEPGIQCTITAYPEMDRQAILLFLVKDLRQKR